MRIAIVGTRGIPASYGGFETFAEQLSIRLAARGHDVTVFGRSHFVDRQLDGQLYQGVRIRVLPTVRHKYLDTVVHTLLSLVACLRHRHDVVLICNAVNSPLSPLARLGGARVVVNVDGIERQRRKWSRAGKAAYRLGEWGSIRLPDAFVADAEVVAEYYRERYGADPVVIPYGGDFPAVSSVVALQEHGIRPHDYVLYVSRLEPENNADVVIRAFRELKTPHQLVIVGDAPYADAYKRHLRQLAQGDPRILFTGYQFGLAYQELLCHAACYVQATEVGGTHPALVEAMGSGNCVIANGTPENLEVIGSTALSYRINDAQHLSELLASVLSDDGLRREYGRRAAARVSLCYTWDLVTRCYEDLFARLVNR